MIHDRPQRDPVVDDQYAPQRPAGQPGSQPGTTQRPSWPAWVTGGLVIGVNILIVSGVRFPFLGPAAGFWFLIGLPVYLFYTASVLRGSSLAERVGYSIAAVLLLLMLAGLVINTVLPVLGMHRPLDTAPVLALGDTLIVSLYILRLKRHVKHVRWAHFRTAALAETRLVVMSTMCLAAAILGANRLNNNAGYTVSLVALVGMVVTFLMLLRWQEDVRDGATSLVLYVLSLALLLMTSLRGWAVTGHDIQVEYQAFQVTAAHAHWDMSYFRSAYNACLSLTILPTEISRVTHVDDPYVYKVFFQAMFAWCPVLVYAISRRFWAPSISILATVYFVGFPTFFTDMPFINRQEISFIFVCAAFLAITNVEWNLQHRRIALCIAALGIELSHYSTMYLFIGTLIVTLTARHVWILNPRRWHRMPSQARAKRAPWGMRAATVGLGSLVMTGLIAFAWGDLATHTGGVVATDAKAAIMGLVTPGNARSNDVAYGLFSGSTVSPQVLLNADRRITLKDRGGNFPESAYIPAAVVNRYATPVVSEPLLPPTKLGSALSRFGVNTASLNGLVRQMAAKAEQIFACIGLVTFLLVPRLRRHVGREVWFFCLGSIVMLVLVTVLPNLSVDYGVLRVFQEALIIIAPVLVAGSLTLFSPMGHVWALRIAAVVCIGIFVSTTGLLPQLLGSYPPQLNLNDEGQYYDIYYTHPQELAAVGWLAGRPGVLPDGVQASYAPNRYLFTAPSDVNGSQIVTDDYPPLVLRSSWVIVGYSTLRSDLATTTIDGDLLTYKYPLGFLEDSKSLVYNNGGAEIFR